MKTRIQKWGNSLAIRIPKSFAAEIGLSEDAPIEMSLSKGRLVVQPERDIPLNLEEMLERVTDENRPGEWDTGPAVGREAW